MSSSSIAKAHKHGKEVPHNLAVPYSRTANERKKVEDVVHALFKKMAADVARQIRGQDLQKGSRERVKLDGHLVVNLTMLDDLATEVQDPLADAYRTAATEALTIVGGESNSDIVNLVNENALAYARERGAEMVGRKWVNGVLVDNPDATWAIDGTTRDMLNDMVSQALDEGWGVKKLADTIEESVNATDELLPFSEYRSMMIARTETISAHNAGTLQGYREAKALGVAVQKEWWPDAEACPICLENADAGPIDVDNVFPSGDLAPTAHPNCECSLIPYVDGEDNSDDGGEAEAEAEEAVAEQEE